MNSRRLFYVLIGVVALMVLGLFGGVYGANMVLQTTAKKVLDGRSKSVALDNQQSDLAKAKADVKKYSALGAIAKSIVPQDKDQAQTVRQIVNIASDNGIKLDTITFPSSTLGALVAPTTPAAGSTTPTAKPPAAAPSQLTAVPSIPGVYSLNIVLQSDTESTVPFTKFLTFLDALEHNRRTALVNGITITPDVKKSGNVSFTLNLQEYIKP